MKNDHAFDKRYKRPLTCTERTYYGMYKLFFIRHLSRNTIL